MVGFSRVGRSTARIKGVILAPLIAAFGWIGMAGSAGAIDLTYAAYRMDGARASAVRPGEMIGSGEKLLIKIKYLNDEATVTPPGFVIFTLPQGCAFVRAEQAEPVEVSVDGGRAFGPLDRLAVREGERLRPATGADVTHIRLALNHPVGSGQGGEIAVIAAHQ